MKAGIVETYNEKKHQKKLESGEVEVGATLQSLLVDLNVLEVEHAYDAHAVLASFKRNLLLGLGIIDVQNEDDEDEDEDEEEDTLEDDLESDFEDED